MIDQADLARLEARITKLESWRMRLIDWIPIVAVAVSIGVVVAVIIAKPRPHDRIEAALARIEQKLGTAP